MFSKHKQNRVLAEVSISPLTLGVMENQKEVQEAPGFEPTYIGKLHQLPNGSKRRYPLRHRAAERPGAREAASLLSHEHRQN